MKTVAFVCLLSVSLCLSLPQTQQGTPPSESQPAPSGKPELKTPLPAPHEEAPKPANQTATNPPPAVTPPKTAENSSQPINDTPKQNATITPEAKTESPAKLDNTTNTVVPPKDDKDKKETDGKPATEKPTEESKTTPPSGTPATVKPATEKSTETPKDTTEKPLVAARGFDGPSFIGGIILTLGLLAIGFMGFKYYKNQTERNYHTL